MIFRPFIILITWPLYIAVKFSLMAIGLVAVPLSLLGDGFDRTPKMWWLWGNDEPGYRKDTFLAMWWERSIRNPVGNLKYLFKDTEDYVEYGESNLETKDGFQWRYRYSGAFDSFRCTWGERRNKGKREIYLGWKIGSSVPGLSFTTQLRPF